MIWVRFLTHCTACLYFFRSSMGQATLGPASWLSRREERSGWENEGASLANKELRKYTFTDVTGLLSATVYVTNWEGQSGHSNDEGLFSWELVVRGHHPQTTWNVALPQVPLYIYIFSLWNESDWLIIYLYTYYKNFKPCYNFFIWWYSV